MADIPAARASPVGRLEAGWTQDSRVRSKPIAGCTMRPDRGTRKTMAMTFEGRAIADMVRLGDVMLVYNSRATEVTQP